MSPGPGMVRRTAAITAAIAAGYSLVRLGGALSARELSAARAITPRGALPAEEQSMIDLFERAKGSVVFITTSERVVNPWTRNVMSVPRGTGSGFIWDEQGHV